MALPLLGIAGIVSGVIALASVIGIGVRGHQENLSQEKQQEAILDSGLSETAKQSALEALYGQSGDVIVGVNPTGGADTDQSVHVPGSNNNVNAEPTIVEPEKKSDLSSFFAGIGTMAVPVLALGVGLVLVLRGAKK